MFDTKLNVVTKKRRKRSEVVYLVEGKNVDIEFTFQYSKEGAWYFKISDISKVVPTTKLQKFLCKIGWFGESRTESGFFYIHKQFSKDGKTARVYFPVPDYEIKDELLASVNAVEHFLTKEKPQEIYTKIPDVGKRNNLKTVIQHIVHTPKLKDYKCTFTKNLLTIEEK